MLKHSLQFNPKRGENLRKSRSTTGPRPKPPSRKMIRRIKQLREMGAGGPQTILRWLKRENHEELPSLRQIEGVIYEGRFRSE